MEWKFLLSETSHIMGENSKFLRICCGSISLQAVRLKSLASLTCILAITSSFFSQNGDLTFKNILITIYLFEKRSFSMCC